MPNPIPNDSPVVRSYRELAVWQLAMETVVTAYRVTRAFPADERFGLTAQLRRAAVSIPANIAEGRSRLGPGEFRHGVSVARGSVAEVETDLAIAIALEFVDARDVVELTAQLDRLSKMLFGLHRSLER
ncbi:MAG TPA: four helix bundle protein [Gemmatimonadaceae bacterium]|jgi:four helix bundle protein|nr:four helix bundle protein [Gemmatimonadaceae bacterium]